VPARQAATFGETAMKNVTTILVFLAIASAAHAASSAGPGTLGYLSLDPGDAPLAREVFVNNATDGTPEKSGHRWDLRLDARYHVKGGRLAGAWFCFGPRLSLFRGTFDFVGGNETFDVTTNQPGVGAGFEELYAIGPRTNLAIGAGADWYAAASFTGHGSTYGPDGTLVDTKEHYSYADADRAIGQPRFAPRVTVGLQHRLGR